MSALENPAVVFCVMGILLTGFASACAVRLSVGSRGQSVFQLFFLFCLLVVGVATLASLGMAPHFWVASASTFSLMVVMATWDFGRPRRVTAL